MGYSIDDAAMIFLGFRETLFSKCLQMIAKWVGIHRKHAFHEEIVVASVRNANHLQTFLQVFLEMQALFRGILVAVIGMFQHVKRNVVVCKDFVAGMNVVVDFLYYLCQNFCFRQAFQTVKPGIDGTNQLYQRIFRQANTAPAIIAAAASSVRITPGAYPGSSKNS